MVTTIINWIIIILSFVNSGYMFYDGTRAILKGDYIRPKTGEYAGQLGPWTKLVEKIGIDPMSTTMKSIFILFGLFGLILTTCFAMNVSWAWKAMMIYNVCCLWNLFFGTASSVVQIVFLIVIRFVK